MVFDRFRLAPADRKLDSSRSRCGLCVRPSKQRLILGDSDPQTPRLVLGGSRPPDHPLCSGGFRSPDPPKTDPDDQPNPHRVQSVFGPWYVLLRAAAFENPSRACFRGDVTPDPPSLLHGSRWGGHKTHPLLAGVLWEGRPPPARGSGWRQPLRTGRRRAFASQPWDDPDGLYVRCTPLDDFVGAWRDPLDREVNDLESLGLSVGQELQPKPQRECGAGSAGFPLDGRFATCRSCRPLRGHGGLRQPSEGLQHGVTMNFSAPRVALL